MPLWLDHWYWLIGGEAWRGSLDPDLNSIPAKDEETFRALESLLMGPSTHEVGVLHSAYLLGARAGQGDEAALALLLRGLAETKSWSERVARACMHGLAVAGPAGVSGLVELLQHGLSVATGKDPDRTKKDSPSKCTGKGSSHKQRHERRSEGRGENRFGGVHSCVRSRAAFCLGEIGSLVTCAAVAALAQTALHDPCKVVQRDATEALGNSLRFTDQSPPPSSSAVVLPDAGPGLPSETLAHCQESVKATVLQNTRHPCAQVRFTAVHALARLACAGLPMTPDVLAQLHAVEAGDSNRYARAWAHAVLTREDCLRTSAEHDAVETDLECRRVINTRWCPLTNTTDQF